MTKEEKTQILEAVDFFNVSYIITSDEIIYDLDNNEGMIMSVGSQLYQKPNGHPVLRYIIEVNDEATEQEDVEPNKPISKQAQDIIDIMQKCARKVMYQQMTLLQNKYMHQHVYSSKEHA